MNQQNIIDRNDLEENGMNEYERQTIEWNRSNQVQEMRSRRYASINNTPGYETGNRIHHLQSIQICDRAEWNELFGREILNPELERYAEASLDWVNDETRRLLFAGQMEVSLLMQENFRPGVHLAIFFIHLTPHRHFRDAHVIQMEFGEGSYTHQTLTRMFDFINDAHVIIQQATEYQMLAFVADDDEAMDLLHNCLLQPDFAPTRFSFVEPNPNDQEDYGYYIANPHADDNHQWHEMADDADADAAAAAVAFVPPPRPINNFAEIYQAHLERYDDDDEYHDDNIIPYDSDDESDDGIEVSG